jgi:hypothetical protein
MGRSEGGGGGPGPQAHVRKPGRPPGGNEVEKPWEKEGVSRKTWYRRRKLEKERPNEKSD